MRIVVAFGGKSVEHQVSIITAYQILKTMIEKHQIIICYVDQEGQLYAKKLKELKDKEQLLMDLHEVELKKDGYIFYLQKRKYRKIKYYFDFVLPLFHGGSGENGSFQGMLQFMNIPYGLSNHLSLACMQDKEMMKHLLQEANIPTLRYFVIHEWEMISKKVEHKLQRLGYPLILKGANLGSSIGIEVVYQKEKILDALKRIYQYDHKVIVENYLEKKKEYHLAIDPHHYSQIELIECEGYYDFKNKYQINKSVKQLPAKIDEIKRNKMIEYGKECLKIFQIDSMVRIDFIEDSNGEIYVNEINGIPGSLAYPLWEASGVSLDQLIETIIIDGMKRYRKQASKKQEWMQEVCIETSKYK